jgi:hypothetical protein
MCQEVTTPEFAWRDSAKARKKNYVWIAIFWTEM